MSSTGLSGGGSGGSRGGESLHAIVRALGSLLTALGATSETAATAAPDDAAAEGNRSELIFEDARRQAYATIDEAVERARAVVPANLGELTARLSRLEQRVEAIASRIGGVPASAPSEGARAAPVGATNGASTDAFEPGLGSLLIAVGPVSGFQGLMRVQSAIAGVDAVDEVAIEGYARSQATVRALIGAPLEPQRVADALARELGQTARVRETSAAERRVTIALGE